MNNAASHHSLFENTGFIMPKTSGNSMRPLIWSGQHCVAVVPLENEPAVGDLLFFTHTLPDGNEKNIVHRLVEIRHDGKQHVYITRGDNCLGSEQVRRSEIIGRVAEVHRISGYRLWHAVPKKQFAVTDPAYIIYTRFWLATWPVRRLFYILCAHIRAMLTRLLPISRPRSSKTDR